MKNIEQSTRSALLINIKYYSSLAQSVKVIISIAVFLTYPLQLYVPIQVIGESIKSCFSPKYETSLDYTIRILLVVNLFILVNESS